MTSPGSVFFFFEEGGGHPCNHPLCGFLWLCIHQLTCCISHLCAYLAALPTNPPAWPHRVWSRNGREGRAVWRPYANGLLQDAWDDTRLSGMYCTVHRCMYIKYIRARYCIQVYVRHTCPILYAGVCNTDNFSLLSITIDYGPFGFLDKYDPGKWSLLWRKIKLRMDIGFPFVALLSTRLWSNYSICVYGCVHVDVTSQSVWLFFFSFCLQFTTFIFIWSPLTNSLPHFSLPHRPCISDFVFTFIMGETSFAAILKLFSHAQSQISC